MKAICTNKNEKMGYVKPQVDVIEIEIEGVICASGSGEGVDPQEEEI